MRVAQIGLVDRGAGKGVEIAFWKRRDDAATGVDMSNLTAFQKAKASLDDILTSIEGLDAKKMAALKAALNAMAEAANAPPAPEQIAEIRKAAPGMVGCPACGAEIAKAEGGQYTCPKCGAQFSVASPVAASLPAEVQKRLDDEQAKRIDLEKRLAESEEREEKRVYFEKAAPLKHLTGVTQDEMGGLLRAIEKKLDKDTAAKFQKALAGWNEAIAKGALFAERGAGGNAPAGSPLAQLTEISKRLREADPKLSAAQAFTNACAQHPDIYAAHRAG